MTESKLYQRHIKPLLLKKGYFFYRVEHECLPDIYACKNNQVVWIELKVLNKKSKLVRPDWREGQMSWIMKHTMEGNNRPGIVVLCLWYINQYYFLYPQTSYFEEEISTYKHLKFNLK